jgi:UDP-glucose 4-epimerase
MIQSSSQIIYLPFECVYPDGFEEIPHRRPNVTKLTTSLQFQPKVLLEEGLQKTITWFREELYG